MPCRQRQARLLRFRVRGRLGGDVRQPESNDVLDDEDRSQLGLLAAIVRSSDDAIIGVNRRGVVTSWNPAAGRMYGYAAEEIVGQPGTTLCPPDRVAEFTDAINAIVNGEQVVRYRTARQRKDGSTIPVAVTVSPVRDRGGALIGASSVARDVTGQLEAEVMLARQTDDLRQAYRNLEAFSYTVSHDLRAPLGAMAGFSAALLEDFHDALGEEGRGYAERIRAGSERMMALVDQLLRVSCSSQAVLCRQAVDLGAEVRAAVRELRERDPGRQVTVTVQDGVWVSADPDLIRSVVQNLVENAWKYTSRRADAHIDFAARSIRDGRVCCHVRDDGVGFDSAYAGKLFQPFQRLHSARDYPGTGVGLAVVRQIVERHGGQVRAEGVPDVGATFYFTLDVKEPA